MSSRLFIHAPNIHAGGGRSLLLSILANIPKDLDFKLTVDDRLGLPSEVLIEKAMKRVSPSLFGRIGAEIWLAKNVKPGDSVLCFGNLPPLFKLQGRVVVFVQNRYLVDDVKLDEFSVKSKLRLVIERNWLLLRVANADEYIVQTTSMERLLEARLDRRIKTSVLPFYEEEACFSRNSDLPVNHKDKEYDFLYVASGEPHKNHRRLIKAWCDLAAEEIRPSLLLTLDETKCFDLLAWINQKIGQFELNVRNLGSFDYNRIDQLYDLAGALIYPSTIESFGLPLVEASQLGLPVVASELDYVRDILDPDHSFDPNSSISIARAVKRHLGQPGSAMQLQGAKEFIEYILDER